MKFTIEIEKGEMTSELDAPAPLAFSGMSAYRVRIGQDPDKIVMCLGADISPLLAAVSDAVQAKVEQAAR